MQKQNNAGKDVMRYAGLGAQILLSLGLAVFAGYHADRWLNVSFPILVWVLPLLVVSVMIYQLIKETSSKNGPKK